MKSKSYKAFGAVLGLILGFGAPFGSIFFRYFYSQPAGADWMRDEIRGHQFYYAYMTVASPFFFSLFGFGVGFVMDRLFSQKESLENMNHLLKQQSATDDLTGLYNQRHIVTELEKELERALRYKHALSGMIVDIDNFKRVNEQHGPAVGDFVLKQVAQALDQSVRRIDIIGRYEGDRFLILLPEASLAASKSVAQRIQKNLGQCEFKVKGMPLFLTTSIGVTSLSPIQSVDKAAFLEKIDSALISAKKSGKNRIAEF